MMDKSVVVDDVINYLEEKCRFYREIKDVRSLDIVMKLLDFANEFRPTETCFNKHNDAAYYVVPTKPSSEAVRLAFGYTDLYSASGLSADSTMEELKAAFEIILKKDGVPIAEAVHTENNNVAEVVCPELRDRLLFREKQIDNIREGIDVIFLKAVQQMYSDAIRDYISGKIDLKKLSDTSERIEAQISLHQFNTDDADAVSSYIQLMSCK